MGTLEVWSVSEVSMGLFSRFWAHPPRLTQDAAEQELKAWRIVEATNHATGEVAVFRIRMTRPARPDLATMTTAIAIKWRYQSSSQMPAEDVNQQQLRFERALDPLACENDNSELVQVTTGMGLKEWVFYARSRDLFMARFNELLRSCPEYPLEIEFFDDPDWHVWGDVVQSLKAKGGAAIEP
jgi:hypothetical protein